MANGNGSSGRDILTQLLAHAEEAKKGLHQLQVRMAGMELSTVAVATKTEELNASVKALSLSVSESKASVDGLLFTFNLMAESLAQLGSFLEAAQGTSDRRLRAMEEKVKRLEAIGSLLEARLEALEKKGAA